MQKVKSRLMITSSIATILFIILATLVTNGVTQQFDQSFLLWGNAHASPAFDSFFLVVTEFGGVIVVTAVTVLLFAYLLAKKQHTRALLVALSVGGAALVGFILKAIFERPRPDLWEWLIVETNFSFPSGHAIASSALALCIAALLWRTKWRTLAITFGALFVALIGISRLYLGVHYPSDIIGGWLVSAAWVSFVVCIVFYRLFQKPIPEAKTKS